MNYEPYIFPPFSNIFPPSSKRWKGHRVVSDGAPHRSQRWVPGVPHWQCGNGWSGSRIAPTGALILNVCIMYIDISIYSMIVKFQISPWCEFMHARNSGTECIPEPSSMVQWPLKPLGGRLRGRCWTAQWLCSRTAAAERGSYYHNLDRVLHLLIWEIIPFDRWSFFLLCWSIGLIIQPWLGLVSLPVCERLASFTMMCCNYLYDI
jgi:hypothetical protein